MTRCATRRARSRWREGCKPAFPTRAGPGWRISPWPMNCGRVAAAKRLAPPSRRRSTISGTRSATSIRRRVSRWRRRLAACGNEPRRRSQTPAPARPAQNRRSAASPPLMTAFLPLLVTLVAYLVGSLSFAVIVSRAMGLSDPRTYGSGNPGATNVLRSGNKTAAILTLLFDALKGYVPVLLVQQFGKPYGLGDGTVALAGLAAFLGHLWPV